MKELTVRQDQTVAIVRQNDGHPEAYLFIHLGPAQYFLGVLVPGMTRGDVRQMAREWLRNRSVSVP